MVYLDYNATTPLAPEVMDKIKESLSEAWGNPSSVYTPGLKAKTMISEARQHVADMIDASPGDIIFTSGGTETNNWVLQQGLKHFKVMLKDTQNGVGDCEDKQRDRKLLPHFITSNVEHDSVKLVLQHFRDENLAEVTFVPVCPETGAVCVDDVMAAIKPNTIMISLMLANNETGIIQPVKEVCDRVRGMQRGPGETHMLLVHTDAAQAIGKIPVSVRPMAVDYLTIVGHKFYGPRIGALYAFNPVLNTPLSPLFFGGGQEQNMRPGTENTPMIAGLGKAAQLVYKNISKYSSHMEEIRDYLEERLQDTFGDGVRFNGKLMKSERLPNTCNVSFVGQDLTGGAILARAPSVQASVGAACHAQDRPSHILISCGVPEDVAAKALRISVGRETTREDIDIVVQELSSLLCKI